MRVRGFKREVATAVVALLAVVLVGCVPQDEPTGPPQGAQWGVTRLDIAAAPGSVQFVTVGLSGDISARSDLQVKATGGIASQVTPGDLIEVGQNLFEVNLRVDVASSATSSSTGDLVLNSGSEALTSELPVKIDLRIPNATDIPTAVVEPAPDRVGQLATGETVVIDEIVVTVDFDHASPDDVARQAAATAGGVILGADPSLRLYQIRVSGVDRENLRSLGATLAALDGVTSASLNHVEDDPYTRVPDDTEWDSWTSAGGNNWGLKHINAVDAWDQQVGDKRVRVAIIDGDNDQNHGDLRGNVSRSDRGPKSFDGHGTHVAGTACAEGNNERGITGVAWKCDLRFFAAPNSTARLASVMKEAAVDGAKVVNLSLQYILNGVCTADDTPGGRDSLQVAADEANTLLGQAVIYAQRNSLDVLWVLAAGNECGRDANLAAPAGLGSRFPQTTMTVASIGRSGDLSDFSNIGRAVSVAAPGEDILSTTPRNCVIGLFCDDNYDTMSGTSMASPHVAGLAALVRSEYPGKSASEVKSCIVAAAQRRGTAVPGQPFRTIDAPTAVSCEDAPDLPNKVDVMLAIDLTGSMGGALDLVKTEVTDLINNLVGTAPDTDFRFGVVTFEDYPGYYDSTVCGSTYSSDYGDSSDEPYTFRSPLSGNAAATQATVDGLYLGSGYDGPESYGRVLWEIGQSDNEELFGWRSDALRLVLTFGDNVPHDTDIKEGVDLSGLGDESSWLPSDTGIDPGRNGVIDCGGDDIDFQDDALQSLIDSDTRLLFVDSSWGPEMEPFWRHWTSLTGGAYTQLNSDRTLTDVMVELLGLLRD